MIKLLEKMLTREKVPDIIALADKGVVGAAAQYCQHTDEHHLALL